MADKNIAFHEGTPDQSGQASSYGYQPSGENGGDPWNGEAFGWSGADEPDTDDNFGNKTTYGKS